MSYVVTGATGFIGRRLVQELLATREGTIFVITRAGSMDRMERLIRQWGGVDRVLPIVGDLSEPGLGVHPDWTADQIGGIEHFFHLAAIYDITADAATNDLMNIEGTRHALALAEELQVGCFHQVSSVAAAGDYEGVFTEEMFDEGQPLPSPYHARSSSPSGSCGRRPRCRGGSTARRSWSATPPPARWTRSTAPTTCSR